MKLQYFWPAAVLGAILCGCSSVATFDYAAAPGTMARFGEKGAGTKSIAVLPFMDQRRVKYFRLGPGGAESHAFGDHGSLYLGLIPLFPFGYIAKEEPENSSEFVSLGYFHCDFPNELANAAFLSLKASNLFSSVVKAGTVKQAGTDYLWRGRILNTRYRGRLFSCCLTYFLSPVLWAVGIPSGSSTNELWVDFDLVDRATGKAVWTYSFRDSDYLNHWLYARTGKDVSIYPRLMKQAMNGALYDLSQKLPALEKPSRR